jgi:hypothetical protein
MERCIAAVVTLAILGSACSPEAPLASAADAPAQVDAGSLRNALAAADQPPGDGRPDSDRYVPPTLPDLHELRACEAGLKARGLKPEELQIMLGIAEGMCPNLGVTEARIRQIADIWEAAGCRQYTRQQVLHALNSGACGGDAG